MIQLLIDGYNLLFLWRGQPQRLTAPESLLKSEREFLLNALTKHLPSEILGSTTIVFDSRRCSSQVDDASQAFALQVLFATQHESADALIVELIQSHSAPARLIVVSSDRYIQQVARRRRANAISSESFIEQIESGGAERLANHEARRRQFDPSEPASKKTVNGTSQYWMEYLGFGDAARSSTSRTATEPIDGLSEAAVDKMESISTSNDSLIESADELGNDVNAKTRTPAGQSIDFRKRARRRLPPGEIVFDDADHGD